ncbi:MAG: 50S ribosomal protein L34e [Candidatus Micrarchaeota archaeon]
MTSPRMRSTNAKTRMRRTPTGRRTQIQKPKKPSPARCALCACILQAVPRRGRSEMAKLSKTEKRPERVYGGVLCAACSQQLVKEKTRLATGVLLRSEVPITHLKYIQGMKK